MGNTVANIGANDTARKASVSDQHMRNEQSLSKQKEDIYNQQAANTAAAAQDMSNAMMSAASALDGPGKAKTDVGADAGAGGKTASDYFGDKLLKNVTGV